MNNNMKPFIPFLMVCFLIPLSLLQVMAGGFDSSETTPSGILLDMPWKKKIAALADSLFQHSAWGVAHFERVYHLAIGLAKEENFTIDEDVIFAAAFLHDMGAFSPYRKNGTDHAKRSAEVCVDVLHAIEFPMEKVHAVQDAILTHSYYDIPSEQFESIVLHDADTLDFLGAIGIVRIISVTSRGSWASDLPKALSTLKKFRKELPEKLVTESAKKIGRLRVQEMETIFTMLDRQSHLGTAL